jgi:hypothetical protein
MGTSQFLESPTPFQLRVLPIATEKERNNLQQIIILVNKMQQDNHGLKDVS